MSEIWTCSKCGRTVAVPDDPEHAFWELVEDPDAPDPEDWPVICPSCLYTPEDLEAIRKRVSELELSDSEKEELAGKVYGWIAEQEGRN